LGSNEQVSRVYATDSKIESRIEPVQQIRNPGGIESEAGLFPKRDTPQQVPDRRGCSSTLREAYAVTRSAATVRNHYAVQDHGRRCAIITRLHDQRRRRAIITRLRDQRRSTQGPSTVFSTFRTIDVNECQRIPHALIPRARWPNVIEPSTSASLATTPHRE